MQPNAINECILGDKHTLCIAREFGKTENED